MHDQVARKEWMELIAKSSANTVASLFSKIDNPSEFQWLRQPEIGSVMVRGRMGATGGLFNLGEITVTRCSLRLPSGQVGHGYVQGRNKQHAEHAALIDALMQSESCGGIDANILRPLKKAQQSQKSKNQKRADNTKVDFFTLVRGED